MTSCFRGCGRVWLKAKGRTSGRDGKRIYFCPPFSLHRVDSPPKAFPPTSYRRPSSAGPAVSPQHDWHRAEHRATLTCSGADKFKRLSTPKRWEFKTYDELGLGSRRFAVEKTVPSNSKQYSTLWPLARPLARRPLGRPLLPAWNAVGSTAAEDVVFTTP